MSLWNGLKDFLESAVRIGMGKTNGDLVVKHAKEVAKEAAGKPYKWSGDDVSGFDCSGYVQFALKRAFPNKEALHEKDRTAEQIVLELADEVSSGGAGDLVFFPKMDTVGSDFAHIGIMIDETSFLGSQSSTGVAQVSLHNWYWKKRSRKFYRLRSIPSAPVKKRLPGSISKQSSGAKKH